MAERINAVTSLLIELQWFIEIHLLAQVSWIRKRDLHILTVGILTYTNDQRYQSLHSDGSDEWTLRITSPQPRDSGVYECQISTEPKISLAFRLSVIGKRMINFLLSRIASKLYEWLIKILFCILLQLY